MCSLGKCCVTCLYLLSLTYICVAAPWTKGTKEGDLLSVELKAAMESGKEELWTENKPSEEAKQKLNLQMMPLFEFNSRIKYLPQEDETVEEIQAAEAEAEEDRLRRANKTKLHPITPDMDSDNIREEDITDPEESEMENLSVIWYLGAFGGLVTFFLVIVCSEFCFGNAMYRRHNPNEYINRVNVYADAYFPQTPPPPYHLFAPPTYTDTLSRKFNNAKMQTEKNDSFDKNPIFIVPVHANKMPYPPPSYTA